MASGLATRCPACGTVFRVVLDQLRVSEGWVRCGRCSDVFNAGQALLDLESGETRRLVLEPPAAGRLPATPPAGGQDTIAGFIEPPRIEHAEPSFETVADGADATPASGGAAAPEPTGAEAATAAAGSVEERAEPAPEEMPSFVRRAERARRWRQPRVRTTLAGLASVLALVLAVQVVHTYRDAIAARVPAARGTLDAVCQALGCRVGAPHAIEQISVESSGLVRVERSSLYRLAVALRNRATFEVSLPAVEVAVSDAQGKLLARRVLRPAEMGASQLALGAGRDLLLQATLQITTEPVAGYTVEIFYP